MDAAIELRNVTKTFGRTTAVKDLNLMVPYGGLYGFIGPNGAGKTTTIRLILSIFFPDSGEISVLGHTSALQARNRIGYLPEERGVYRKMRVGAFLNYIAGSKESEIRISTRQFGLCSSASALAARKKSAAKNCPRACFRKYSSWPP